LELKHRKDQGMLRCKLYVCGSSKTKAAVNQMRDLKLLDRLVLKQLSRRRSPIEIFTVQQLAKILESIPFLTDSIKKYSKGPLASTKPFSLIQTRHLDSDYCILIYSLIFP
jgi:hypothetical protein